MQPTLEFSSAANVVSCGK